MEEEEEQSEKTDRENQNRHPILYTFQTGDSTKQHFVFFPWKIPINPLPSMVPVSEQAQHSGPSKNIPHHKN